MSNKLNREIGQPWEKWCVPIVVGVTGHRDIPLEDIPKLEASVSDQLACFENKYRHSRYVLLTGLAEGADRLVARCAIARGWSLGGVLALPRAEFEADFSTAASVAEFRDLLSRCDRVEEVAPAGHSRPECYELVGEWISIHAQCLIALWDGTDNGKKGGTADVVKLFREGRPKPKPVLPDTGPVIQIVTRRQSGVPAVDARTVGETKRLAPNPLGLSDPEKEEERWAEVLVRIDSFNKVARDHRESDFSKTRQYLNANQLLLDSILPGSARNASWLFAIADHMAGSLQKKRDRLFLLVLVLAIAGLGLEKFYSGLSDGIGWPGGVWLLCALACGTLALLFANVPLFFRETDYMDYRSLAEACRVQYFWKRLGIKDCVADFHLFAQRDELEWIRQAIRTTELGPNSSQAPAGQVLMEEVLCCWVKDQRKFYLRRYEDHKRDARFLNALALWLFCLGGLAMVATLVLHVSGADAFIKWAQFSYGMLLTLSVTTKVYLFTKGHEEHARSYLRADQSMQVAEKVISERPDEPTAKEMFHGLGKAALDENGDWLLLHRDRLIEPPIG